MSFKVLIVPGKIDSGLDLLVEAMRLGNMAANSNNLTVKIVPPDRSKEIDLVQLTRGEGQRFDCLHFLGHSDGTTFELASGDVLDEDKIMTLCRDAGAKVLFLNACSSAALCQFAANTTVAVALAWAKEVVDSDAIVAAMRFYGALSEYGEPWGGGLRRAYEATGEKRFFLWFTDGHYVSEMIKPIINRLDRFDTERKEAFSLFSGRLDSIVQSLSEVGEKMSSGLGRLTNSYGKIRLLLYAIAILMVVVFLSLVYAFSTSAQTIPDPTPTFLPGCGPSGGQPAKCNTPTPTDAPGTIPDSTEEERPTDAPEPPTATITPVATQTDAPTETASPTPAETIRATHTATPRPTHTDTPRPTVELPTPTPDIPTPTEVIIPCL